MSESGLTHHSKLLDCLSRVRKLPESTLNESWIREELGFDSLDIVDLFFELEVEFKISLGLREFQLYLFNDLKRIEQDFTVGELQSFVLSKLS